VNGVDLNRVSVVLEGNLGGFPVTLCSCGVLCMSSMAHIHAEQCDVFKSDVAAMEATAPHPTEGGES
jgi:hypothetical protein